MCLGEGRIIRNEASKQKQVVGGHIWSTACEKEKKKKAMNGAALYCSAANGTLIQKADKWRSIVKDWVRELDKKKKRQQEWIKVTWGHPVRRTGSIYILTN